MTDVMRGAALAREEQLEMLRQMVRIRRFEERLALLFKRGRLPGFVHLYLGEEAVAVGVCSALRDDDRITSTHRGHGHLIAKGAQVDRMMAELFGRVDGYCRGKGGSMHIVDFSLGIIGTNGIVGGGIPIGTGSAWGDKQLGRDNVTVTFFGDGASNQGVFFEAMNLAAIWKLPVVFVCENNGYTEWTPTHRLTAGKIADRGAAMGIPGVQVDGNDVLAVRQATEEAVARARAGEGPSLIEAATYRWHGHNEGEEAFAGQYRPQDEQDEWRTKEPIARFRRQLIDAGIAGEEELDRIDAEEVAAVDAAVAFADASPFPDADEALAHLYADRTEGARS
ncbi:thiamine pyrophosphate-dependent dehydrogenase E1 component subunit alpha [Sphaerisporangium krabiense]|uniref:Pyruvate dehydrogenase E1 component alpha subunit n=1 Tax=Sphaerisporangium krabiense TaxID=763782 RepID=A0A7W8Z2A5_9ACTN|nr:thiamine pyrophosphate-dependent dehydrogenase E1 component subunit alpha [Sphaerisporangium krabiense]MBB5626096.1 pyruvate dehydrogenase E1 component alpha subunit [Sphaerisporangium krabiense]